MAEPTVLVAGDDSTDAEALESALSADGASITVERTDISDVHARLCNSTVHCLLLSADVNGKPAAEVTSAVRTFYPDLPVVVADPDGAASADASVVPADSLADPAVVETVRTALDGQADGDAARPPSRMETLLLSLFEELPAHMFAKDEEARHVLAGDYLDDGATMLGLTDRDIDALPQDVGTATHEDDLRVIEEGEPHLEVEEYVESSGRDRADVAVADEGLTDALTSKVPWYDVDGEVIGLAGITQDITEQKYRDHATRRHHERLAKVALVAAHELRNEIQIAYGRLQAAETDSEHVDAATDSLSRLSGVVDDLVDLASRERLDLDERVVWLSSLSRDVWERFDDPAATLELTEDCRLHTDPESAKLVLETLFENALEHGRGGGRGDNESSIDRNADLTVTVAATDEGFAVADDGAGIDVDPIDRVFDAAYTTKSDKTGFGLYVAERIADDLGWSIDVAESEAGGARFEVTGLSDPPD